MSRARSSSGSTASSARPSARPRPSLTFYPAEVDGSPAAFVVDLEQSPQKSHPTRIIVAIPMREPTEDGLRSEAEMQGLDDAQEAITERLGKAFDAQHVGFYDLNGATTLVFYAKGKTTEDKVADAIGDIGPYGFDVHVAKDAEWRFYIDVLFPDAYALQGIYNRALIDEHESHGDALEEPRDVDHLASFPSSAAAQKAAKKLAAAHFHVDSIGPGEEKGRFDVNFHRSETLEDDKPNQFSAEILDLVLPLDGEYDGWGAPAVGGAQDSEPRKKGGAKAKTAAPAKEKAKKASTPAKAKAAAPAKAKAKAKKAAAPVKAKTKKAAPPAKAKAKAKKPAAPAKAKAKAKKPAAPAKAKAKKKR